jgi:1-acyl-sn-glycerol-3-phosphate acyltransferase
MQVMKFLRLLWRGCLLCLLTGASYLLWLPGRLWLSHWPEAKWRWRRIILTSWAQLASAIMGLRIKITGRPPTPPFYLVSNHLSYLDIVVYAAHLNCLFVAKSEVQKWPALGWLANSIGTIFLARNNKRDIPRVIKLINRHHAAGLGIVIFAEGTSTKGEAILPLKPALLEPAAQAGYPVSYASLRYEVAETETPAWLSVCWWGDMAFLPHLKTLLQIPEIQASVIYGERTIRAAERKQLAQELWQALDAQFVPLITPQK